MRIINLNLINLFATALLFTSCTGLTGRILRRPFVLEGPQGASAIVYSINDASKKDTRSYLPHSRVAANESIELELGLYYIANDCSGFVFQHKGDGTKIPLSHFKINSAVDNSLIDSSGKKSVLINTQCHDPLDGHTLQWEDRQEFLLLPGSPQLIVGGRGVTVKTSSKNREEITLKLSEISVEGENPEGDLRFFVTPENVAAGEITSVVSVPLGKRLWIVPGDYSIEINGTTQIISVAKDVRRDVVLGALRIDSPKGFPMQERQNAGGGPIFAYINSGVLFNLNTDYLVFPGRYKVSLEGSDVSRLVEVSEKKVTLVKTLGAQINSPTCGPKYKSCKRPPRVTIHKERKPFALMHVDTDIPFLVLDDKYEFGVEGTRGLVKELNAQENGVHKETLARVKFNWEARPSEKHARTDMVRFETTGNPLFGKTLDMLFSKPEELYLPNGHYVLSYYVGELGSDRQKVRSEMTLQPGETREVTVPVYMDKAKGAAAESAADVSARTQKAKGDDLPSSLSPLKR